MLLKQLQSRLKLTLKIEHVADVYPITDVIKDKENSSVPSNL